MYLLSEEIVEAWVRSSTSASLRDLSVPPNSVIHKATGLSATIQNGLWRSFLLAAPFTPNGTFFSGTAEQWNSTRQSREAVRPVALWIALWEAQFEFEISGSVWDKYHHQYLNWWYPMENVNIYIDKRVIRATLGWSQQKCQYDIQDSLLQED